MIVLNIQRFADADIIIETSVDTKGLKDGLKDILNEINDTDVDVDPDIDAEEVENKIDILGKGISKMLTKTFGTFGSILGTIAKTLSKNIMIGIGAVLGIVLLIIGAFKKLLGDNEQLSKQWEQIKNTLGNLFSQIGSALASVFLPLLQSVLNFLQKMLQYVGYILKAWFGIDIYAQKTDKSLSKSTKKAKEMNKQLAGFDEMNVLSDNKGTGDEETGGAGMISPLPEAETPEWLKWLGENGELVKTILLGIATAIGVVMLALNLANPLGWVLLFIGALGLLFTYWDKISAFLLKIGKWVYDNVLKPIIDFFWGFISTIIENAITMIENIYKLLSPVFKWVYDHIIKPVIDAFVSIWDTIKKVFNGCVKFFSGLWNKVKDIFTKFAGKVADTIGGVIKATINGVLSFVEDVLNTPIRAINKLIDVINAVPGIDLKTLKEFNLPRLAKGGIVNMPGRGVMVGGAIAGEAGPEAVLPLTDDTLQKIANMIPITVNLTNTMNGRVISRELQKVQNESNFAFNR